MPSSTSTSTRLWPRQTGHWALSEVTWRSGQPTSRHKPHPQVLVHALCGTLQHRKTLTDWKLYNTGKTDLLWISTRKLQASSKCCRSSTGPPWNNAKEQHNLVCCIKLTVASQQSSAHSWRSSPRQPGVPTPQLLRGYPVVQTTTSTHSSPGQWGTGTHLLPPETVPAPFIGAFILRVAELQ